MSQQHILQVSELTKKVKFILENELNTVWLCGEISNFISAGSGHWYLSLKDNKSQVKCAMFKGNNRRVRITPRNGQQVLVRAKVSLYEPRGDFQLIIEQMDDAGDGLLRQQFDQLKNQLNAQGYFAQQSKQTIPTDIATVGIVTSSTGAAVRDILSVLKRRNPLIKAIIYPCLVQGGQAKEEIVKAIQIANQRNECDVLIVGRGGGSLEDLWPFNEEMVVKAIYHSQIPTVSAVGHEIDTTLADYVADVRAATPTAAAEIISSDNTKIRLTLQQLAKRLHNAINRLTYFKVEQQKSLQHRLNQTHPEQQLRVDQQKSDDLALQLHKAMSNYLTVAKIKPQQLSNNLKHLSPLHTIKTELKTNERLRHQLINLTERLIQSKQERFVHNIDQLQLVSPLATISRGYSVTRNNKGNIIKKVAELTVGEDISIQMTDGQITANVTQISDKL